MSTSHGGKRTGSGRPLKFGREMRLRFDDNHADMLRELMDIHGVRTQAGMLRLLILWGYQAAVVDEPTGDM